jgi:hypothetical protein
MGGWFLMAEYLVQDTALIAIADAIRAKTGKTDALTLEQMPSSINRLSIDIPSIVYIVGNPVEFTLLVGDWNGTTYKLTATGYKVGANGIQIGLPAYDSTVNSQAVVEAALTIVKIDSISNGASIYISAVNTPLKDITIAIFGLEAIE